MPRYFIGQDEDSHWYLIPVEAREEWEKWNNLPEPKGSVASDWDAFETPPASAKRINGYHTLTFSEPNEDA